MAYPNGYENIGSFLKIFQSENKDHLYTDNVATQRLMQCHKIDVAFIFSRFCTDNDIVWPLLSVYTNLCISIFKVQSVIEFLRLWPLLIKPCHCNVPFSVCFPIIFCSHTALWIVWLLNDCSQCKCLKSNRITDQAWCFHCNLL